MSLVEASCASRYDDTLIFLTRHCHFNSGCQREDGFPEPAAPVRFTR